MKGIVFIEKVADSVMDMVHEETYNVTRVAVPDAKIAFSVLKDSRPAIFPCSEKELRDCIARNKGPTRTIEVPDDLVAEISRFIRTREACEADVKRFWEAEALPDSKQF